jgi:hypothetical protein
MVELVPATPEMVRAVCGEAGLPRSAYALAAIEDGRVLGLGAAAVVGVRWIVCCQIHPEVRAELKAYRRPLLEAARRVLALTARRPALPVHAQPDPAVPGAVAFLAHLGFAPRGDGDWELRRTR